MPTVQITNQRRAMTIHRTQKYGDWEFLAYEDPKHTHKNAQKISKNFKPSIHNVVSTGTNFAKNVAFYVPIGCVGFARYCGKIHGRHLFAGKVVLKITLFRNG